MSVLRVISIALSSLALGINLTLMLTLVRAKKKYTSQQLNSVLENLTYEELKKIERDVKTKIVILRSEIDE